MEDRPATNRGDEQNVAIERRLRPAVWLILSSPPIEHRRYACRTQQGVVQMNAVDGASEIPAFLCYRQSDGRRFAEAIYRLLEKCPVSHGAVLHIYFDLAAPAVGDWTAIHLPSLQSSHVMIVIATPGACVRESKDDWVHMELDWWLTNRRLPPIVIDPTGENGRWVPPQVKSRWPTCQRVNLELDNVGIVVNADRIRQQIVEGIRLKDAEHLFEELEIQKRVRRRLVIATVASILASCVSVGVLLFALYAKSQLVQSLALANERVTNITSELVEVEAGTRVVFKETKSLLAEVRQEVCETREAAHALNERLDQTWDELALLDIERQLPGHEIYGDQGSGNLLVEIRPIPDRSGKASACVEVFAWLIARIAEAFAVILEVFHGR